MDELKKIFLAGVGITSTSIEKAEKLINEMVEKGRVTVQEGKELQTELTRKASGIVPATKAELDNLPFAKKEDVEALEAKMDAINAKLDQLLSK
ncbi:MULTISPECIES: phasin family protein [Trichococcus]|jgi:polyhydroxyalkanoate synthesis regulator phasin|uniref:phasin family protein n=1 Tax=Trichococcus TaxID=82802 RepID=UPI000D0AD811|nr:MULTISPECIES: hypothetical protein [Trichococcus]MDB6354399.1 hypothetical protein [Trichococcus sp. K1Tr]